MSQAYWARLNTGSLLPGTMRPTVRPSQRVDAAHPLAVAGGQVVVDRDEVHALARQAVEVGRQRRDEGLALAGLHLGHPAEVQGGAAHQLHVVVALAEHPPAGLADDGEGLDQQVVEGLAAVEPLAELAGLGLEGVVVEALHLGLEVADVGHQRLERPDLLALTGAEEAVKQAHADSRVYRCPDRARSGPVRPRRAAIQASAGVPAATRWVTGRSNSRRMRLTASSPSQRDTPGRQRRHDDPGPVPVGLGPQRGREAA